MLELEARLLRLARNWTADGQPGHTLHPEARVTATSRARHTERMTTFVAAHYQRPIRLADVAAAAGLRPNDASVLFREMNGQSVAEHIRQYRVAHA